MKIESKHDGFFMSDNQILYFGNYNVTLFFSPEWCNFKICDDQNIVNKIYLVCIGVEIKGYKRLPIQTKFYLRKCIKKLIYFLI